jgi:hypothetical protein
MKAYGGVFSTSALVGEWSESPYPLGRRLGGPQSRSGRHGEVNIFDPTGTGTPSPSVVQPVASRYIGSLNLLCVQGNVFYTFTDTGHLFDKVYCT